MTDREGTVSEFQYDEMQRLINKTVGDLSTSYEYDGGGRLIGADNSDTETSIGFDLADRPVRYATLLKGETSAEVVEYSYDAAGRRESMTFAGVTDTYDYDAAGRLSQLSSSASGAFSFSYGAAGERSQLERPNGVVTTYEYDAAGAVTDISHERGGVRLDGAAYSYDAAGRRTAVGYADGIHEFGYDPLGRVTRADHPGGESEVFSYDEMGNRTGRGETYDAANRLLGRDGFTYTYDAEGRLTSRTDLVSGGVSLFVWRADGRLGSVSGPGGTASYRYDAAGRRVAVDKGGSVRRLVFGTDPNAVGERAGGGLSRHTFELGYDAPLATRTGGSDVFYGQDALSSVTALFDASGEVSGRYSYGAYGEVTGHTGAGSIYTYTGREYDAESGTYHYRARQYDPATSRFLSEDPIPAANLYWYADANPVSANDPTGMSPLKEVMTSVYTVQMLAGANLAAWPTALKASRCDNVETGTVIGAGLAGAFGAWAGLRVWTMLGSSKHLTDLVRDLGRYRGRTIVAAAGSAAAVASVLTTDAALGTFDLEALARGGSVGAAVGLFEHLLAIDTALVGPMLIALAVDSLRTECG